MIEADEVSYSYGVAAPTIENFSLRVDAGEMIAITGPSGRGKSTLLYLLGLMIQPTAGRLVVNGQDYTNQPDEARANARARQFGFVFQDAALDPTRTVLDNVLETTLYRDVGRSESIPAAVDLLTRFGVELRQDAKPGEVSGGQAQRIALCRALLNDPVFLLADEPTGNLDQTTASIVLDALRAQADRDGHVIVVTHDTAVAARCDREVAL